MVRAGGIRGESEKHRDGPGPSGMTVVRHQATLVCWELLIVST